MNNLTFFGNVFFVLNPTRFLAGPLTFRKKGTFLLLMITFLLLKSISGSAQELHTHSNAVSIANESNTINGWNAGAAAVTSDTSDPYYGSYAMKVVSTGTGPATASRRVAYTFSATIGQTYDISIWVKTGSQTVDPAFAGWTGVTGFSNPTPISTSGTWAEYTFVVSATESYPQIFLYTGSHGGGAVGDELYIDGVSIVPHSSSDTQPPTSPILSSTGHTDTTVELNWSGSTDNVSVTGYNVYQDGALLESNVSGSSYQVLGLVASTSYNFKVSAIDAAGNESAHSDNVSVTTNAASGEGPTTVWTESGSTVSYLGEVAVGTSSVPSGYTFAVNGKIRTREIRVDQDVWPDYVFEKDYDLLTLEEIQKHIEDKGHLPNIPSATEVRKNGVQLGEMSNLLLVKIEELTLHIIELKREIEQLKNDKNQKK